MTTYHALKHPDPWSLTTLCGQELGHGDGHIGVTGPTIRISRNACPKCFTALSEGRGIDSHLEDVERAQHMAHASAQVAKFAETLARMYADEHPNDPIVSGWHAALSNLAALKDGGIQRGSLRLVQQIGKKP